MAKEKDSRNNNPLWTVFGNWNLHKFVLGKLDSVSFGFTLVELLVVTLIFSLLAVVAMVVLNPLGQIDKARDSRRVGDLSQVRSSLDTYYNDKNKYPTSFSFSGSFTNNNVIYQKTVPNDPVNESTTPYQYEIDFESTTPQWGVLYAKLAGTPSTNMRCPLEDLVDSSGNACVPANYYELGYNYCILLGDVDCDSISEYSFPVVEPTAVPTVTPVPTEACPPSQAIYKCTVGVGSCNLVPAGQGDFCGFSGCSGDACCNNTCN